MRRGRMNEAELVREHRDGLDRFQDAESPLTRPAEPVKPVVRDPVLAERWIC